MTNKQREIHAYPLWSPRFWHGMTFGGWMKLLADNRFQVHPLRVPMAALLCLITPFNTVMRWVQRMVYGRKVAETPIEQPPVFIIGHWRSGTTLLHELMVLDERFAYPTTYQCFAPHHFLLTEWFFAKYCGFLLPKQRPMDNMATGWYKPQEDEFALLTMGEATPYRRMAFPNRGPVDSEFLNMRDIAPDRLQRWRDALQWFVKLLTFKTGKRIVLKSPPHTGRIAELAELFPGAKFIHIAREPYTVYSSTKRLWPALDYVQGCQVPRNEYLDEYVLSCLEQMYDGFDAQKDSLADGQMAYVRYEELVADPMGEIQRLYEELDLGSFDNIREPLAEQVEQRANYRVNQHQLEDADRQRVRERWASYFEAFGYEE